MAICHRVEKKRGASSRLSLCCCCSPTLQNYYSVAWPLCKDVWRVPWPFHFVNSCEKNNNNKIWALLSPWISNIHRVHLLWLGIIFWDRMVMAFHSRKKEKGLECFIVEKAFQKMWPTMSPSLWGHLWLEVPVVNLCFCVTPATKTSSFVYGEKIPDFQPEQRGVKGSIPLYSVRILYYYPPLPSPWPPALKESPLLPPH